MNIDQQSNNLRIRPMFSQVTTVESAICVLVMDTLNHAV